MKARAVSTLELLVVIGMIAIMAALVVMPAYRAYVAARAPSDAAAMLAEDIAVLERAAQNGISGEGSSLIVVSDNPFHYRCYHGRPSSVDPNSTLGALIVERRFAGVALASGAIDAATPLLFASNGSAQYVSAGTVANQHATVEFELVQPLGARSARVDLNLFTGSITRP